MAKETKRQRLEKLSKQLEDERSSFISHWKMLSDFITPRRSRWFVSDANKGDQRNQNIVDGTATYAIRTLRSGMMSGITSPARPWFSLGITGQKDMEPGPLHTWLHEVTQLMRESFNKSNFYQVLPPYYGDLGTYGTATIYVEEDQDDRMRYEIIPLGSYAIGKGANGRVNVITRSFQMTVRQIIEKFGLHNASAMVRSRAKENMLEDWVQVRHVVEPNRDYRPGALEAKYMPFSSSYYETGCQARSGTQQPTPKYDQEKFLRESGYQRFPFFCSRWETLAEDVYATDCPGMTVLGDVKELQMCRRRLMQALDKKVNPPLVGPSSMRNSPISVLPGDMTYHDVREGLQGLRPVHEVNFQLSELGEEMQLTRQRIRKGCFEDLFLMLSQSDRREITAREIEERHEEKLWALGPVLEGLNKDFLSPNIDWTFAMLHSRGELPPPPPELQGKELKIEYVSVMARAMKQVDLGSVDKFMGFIGQYAGADPSIMDKIDGDQVVDLYGDMTGVPAGIIRPDDDVAEIRERRAQQQAQQQKMEQMEQMANTAKAASQADMSGDNALTQALGGAGG